MSRSPWYLALGLMLLLLWSGYLTSQASSRADRAEGRAQVADSLRGVAEARARADSVRLVDARETFVADSARFAQERLRSRQEVVRAAEAVQEAGRALRGTLDVQQAILLDSLEAAHATEIRAKDREIELADSATVVVRSLLQVTEEALASERLAHQSALPVIAALEEQVAALRSVQRRKGIELWVTRGAVVLVALTTVAR